MGIRLNNLAELFRTQGKYADAEPLFQRALRIDEAALGANHPDVAIDLNNLALLYKTQGKYADAEPLYQRSFWIFFATLGPEHPNMATVFGNYQDFLKTNDQPFDQDTVVRKLQQARKSIATQSSSTTSPASPK